MAWITDSLRSAIAAINPFARQSAGCLPTTFTHQFALAAYMSSGMLRKVITIPAEDRVREWRDWQADKEQIEALEAEEKRLGLIAKVKEAETLRGIGGGALVLITAGDHDQPLNPETIRKGGLIAVNVVSRWQLSGADWIKNLASPDYGNPAMWRMSDGQGQQRIHPSRVICFRGEPIPAGSTVSDEDAFWGDCRLYRVFNEVQKSDNAYLWISELIKKAKLLRVGIPGLADLDQDKIAKRVALIAEGENILNATVFQSAGQTGEAGETITDFTMNWSGIPAMMDAFDQRVAAVSNIPFTVLMGRSPAGMNSTGDHDRQNWERMVKAGQELETRPCLEAIDPILLRSAGIADPAGVWWQFAPLSTPTEAEQATRFKTTMEAVEKVQNTGAIPDRAFAEGFQNLLIENGWLPGIEGPLNDMGEDERYGLSAPDDDGSDPSAIQAKGGDPDDLPEGGDVDGSSRSALRAANDAATWMQDAIPRPLYVQRKLLNAAELITWAKDNGFTSTLAASDMHVTVLYSRSEVDPMKMGRDWSENEKGQVIVRPGGPRVIERLGESAVVLRFASPDLEWRHQHMIEAGGSHDYPEYAPHVTLSYAVPEGMDLAAIKAFNGELRFGPEIFEALDLDWKSKVVEK